eukprot:TRINITY_DN15251_c0_g1_i1.p1 TRINITY_DN15251_c0_g1~~TRINITY_DN15251_c0_g1_i1.p1  ORF type:complete len:467 (+),score=58.14 TRINITY_DN15251_c0_g1_i1:34-1434(+)
MLILVTLFLVLITGAHGHLEIQTAFLDEFQQFVVVLRDTPLARNATQIALLVEHNNEKVIWPGGVPDSHLLVRWTSLDLKKNLVYNLQLSNDLVHWGPIKTIECCQYEIPSNLTTLIVSGDWRKSIDTDTYNILIKQNTTIEPRVSIRTKWELTIEKNITIVNSDIESYGSGVVFESSLVDLSGLVIHYTWGKIPSNSGSGSIEILRVRGGVGKINRVVTDTDVFGTCTVTGWNQADFTGEVKISITLSCPGPVKPGDFLVWPLIIIPLSYVLFVVLLKKYFTGSTLAFTHWCFAVAVFLTLALGASIMGIGVINQKRCWLNTTCHASSTIMWITNLIAPTIFFTLALVLMFVWLQVVFLKFKGGCGTFLARRAVYFFGSSFLLGLAFIPLFMPAFLWVIIGSSTDLFPFVGILGGVVLLFPAALFFIIYMIQTCWPWEIVHNCLGGSEDEYRPLGVQQESWGIDN